jgi:hypothetical protein
MALPGEKSKLFNSYLGRVSGQITLFIQILAGE